MITAILNTYSVCRRVMKIFLDCSDPELIATAYETGLIDGVTTNPSLMLRAGEDPKHVIKEISSIFPWQASVSAEVVGETADEMLGMAADYLEIGPNITIKVPCTVEGLKACKSLSDEDVNVNVTLIFSTAQALLAAKAGAAYVSPFVGRVFDQHWNGMHLIEEIADVFATHQLKTEVLAASIREPIQVSDAFRVGADICTISVPIFYKLYKHILTDKGLELFDRDWKELQGKI
ncbi:transaldolase [Synechococcus phage syn9]|uniref:Transaldolase n=1 Tax=Synechococcus phage syn9 TaxID=382359 RepID=Q0QZ26_BPSYS|nr:transaldolase [Synechococcus phage syn9]ABA47170.1 transaldolase [Synechococcus phage syn9]